MQRLLQRFLILCIGAAVNLLLWPPIAQAQRTAQDRAEVCRSNIRVIGAALKLFRHGHQKRYPSSLSKSELSPYIKKVIQDDPAQKHRSVDSFLQCPEDQGKSISYSLNPSVAGISDSEILELTKTKAYRDADVATICVYEGTAEKIAYRHRTLHKSRGQYGIHDISHFLTPVGTVGLTTEDEFRDGPKRHLSYWDLPCRTQKAATKTPAKESKPASRSKPTAQRPPQKHQHP